MRKQYKNNKPKIIGSTWSYEFELLDGFYSMANIQDYINYIIKKNETVTKISSIRVYINRINNGLVLKVKDVYKLELQTAEIMKLFANKKILLAKVKIGENVSSLEVAEVVLVQCNLVDNQYQQNSKVLCTFTPNKFYTYLLNVEPSNIVFLKTFDEIIITFNI